MKNMFESERVIEIKQRVARVGPECRRQWGTMSAAQALAHCTAGVEMALGERKPPRALIGRLIGGIIKPKVLGDDEPMRRNSPTMNELVVLDERDLDREKGHLLAVIDRFAAASPAGCTAHPHSFFGRLTPDEWAILMYKHLDHHLRQFGV